MSLPDYTDPTVLRRQFDWWRKAVRGERGELERGDPKPGFYRHKDRAIALWWGDGDNGDIGKIYCQISPEPPYTPRKLDEIDDQFGWWSLNPISYDAYIEFIHTMRWPEDISQDIEEAKAQLGHQRGQRHEELRAELDAVMLAFNKWLESIGGKITTEEHDKKGDEFKERVAEIQAEAEHNRKEAKEPHLRAGQIVDRTWNPVKDAADVAKKAISKVLTPYRTAREEKRVAEEKVSDKPPGRQPKPKTGLRTYKITCVTDLRAAAAYIAALNDPPEDFVEGLKASGKKLIEAGHKVPGIFIKDEKRA